MAKYIFDEQTRAIIESEVVPIGVYQMVDGHVTTLLVSDGLCELFSYKDRAEAIEKMDTDMYWNVHQDDVKRAVEVTADFIKADNPYNLVCRVMTKDGYRFIHSRGRHITTETGERLAWIWYIDEGSVSLDTIISEDEEKIDELKASMHVLFNNMPALSFSKSVENGRYLACNQAFAEYVQRKSPAEVVGLTEHDIFDKETADQLVADDRMALSLDRPYIFYEDVPDVSGALRRFQSTKLRFIDDLGRLCLLGMSVDVTEMTVMKREAEALKEEAKRIESERVGFSRIMSLSGDFLCIYTVDLNTGYYVEYEAADAFRQLGMPSRGDDFFTASRKNIISNIYPEDLDLFLSIYTRENLMRAIQESGVFEMEIRLMIGDAPTYMRMKAAIRVDRQQELIVGVINIDAQKKREEDYISKLSAERERANRDALTGVRNKNAYIEIEHELNEQIRAGQSTEFALALFDVNGLKTMNDTRGHHAGDVHIKNACNIICDVFKHSPVFRIGGDEFAVIAKGLDYDRLDERAEEIATINRRHRESGKVVIACGMARYKNDRSVAEVFKRADAEMYENKKMLKTV